MKCTICSYEIPEGKKCCPKCGRVITNADRNRASQSTMKVQTGTGQPANGNSSVYKPAASKSAEQQKTIHIPDLFSSDPNAPEYSDPHSYDRATADILEYDRQFITGDNQPAAQSVQHENPNIRNERQNNQYRRADYRNVPIDDNSGYEEDYYEESEYEQPVGDDSYSRGSEHNVIRDKKQARPHLKFNGKMLFVCLAVLIGIGIIVVGVYQLGEQFGFFGEGTSVDTDETSGGKKTPDAKPNSNNTPASAGVKTGTYTVKTEQNNIFVYKSEVDPRIIATIPNGTVITIDEISGDMGKTTYNTYTGWVKLSDLEYTPNTASSGSEDPSDTDTGNGSDTDSYKPGTYTVDLHGDGSYINVRSISSSSGALVYTIPEGTELTVDEIDGSWGHIEYNGIEGWVFMEYLR